MFAADAQRIIDRSKDIAVSLGESTLTLDALGASLVMEGRARSFLSQALDPPDDGIESLFPLPTEMRKCHSKLPLEDSVRELLSTAKQLAHQIPLPSQPGRIKAPHLCASLALSLGGARPDLSQADPSHVATLLTEWVEELARPPKLGDLTRSLRSLRDDLRGQVFGQAQAVEQLVAGLFNTEVVAAADPARRKPRGIFVFAGPPGVGKTYVAELTASYLDRPFKRFDMSSYAQSHESPGLTGSPPVYRGAAPGELTSFVKEHPDAILLFDEIEKTHLTAIHLFLQLLDIGRLQDKYTEESVDFSDTIVIFTTNVGRTLYENEASSGVHGANPALHRNTILDAFRTEVNPRTGEPFFPAAICSRLATGYPILFSHLRVQDLTRVAAAELARVGELLEHAHAHRYRVGPQVPLAIVMREGARTDPRSIKAQAEAFLKEETFKACRLFGDERVDSALDSVAEFAIEIDDAHADEVAAEIFRQPREASVLLIADPEKVLLYSALVPEVDWYGASTEEQVFEVLMKREVDLALLDLTISPASSSDRGQLGATFHDVSTVSGLDRTLAGFDHVPLSARGLAAGQRILQQLHSRGAETPVFLFSLEESPLGAPWRPVDEELLWACIHAGGARGVVRTGLAGTSQEGWQEQRDLLRTELEELAQQLRIERTALEFASQSKVLAFDTAPAWDESGKVLRVRCRNFRLTRALRSSDVEALGLSDVERPATRFADVVGAAGAKEALAFLRDWLKEPKRYAAAGIEPPRGVLLTGPPGTGKTMLARALAGESDCAFLAESATSFVTVWQGSGPQNVRELFSRARRYAPSVVFIDEIDAIGKTRTGSLGAGRAQEETLNALLTEMDGFKGRAARPVLVLAATNHAELLDPALKRRFGRDIDVELPTRAERAQYIQSRLQARTTHEVTEEAVAQLAARSGGLSIATLENVLNQAAVLAFPSDGIITDAILGEAFEQVTLGERKPGGHALRTARHEAGHALLMSLLGDPPIYVTIVGRGLFGGYAAFEDRDGVGLDTKRDLEDRICQFLGGRESERYFYADGLGESTGPRSDLERATRLAEAMVYELGMSEEVGFVRIDRGSGVASDLAGRCHAAVCRILGEQSERARKLLNDHGESLNRIAAALVARSRLTRGELFELLTPDERGEAADQ